jgi:hypothetical protein
VSGRAPGTDQSSPAKSPLVLMNNANFPFFFLENKEVEKKSKWMQAQGDS